MIGKTISHYKILEKLGEGGMGVVYKAEDTKLERTVALKFLSLTSIGDEEKKRFKREAKAAASLNHPNIATIHAIDEVDDQTFIAMEYIEGQSLEEIVGANGGKPMPIDKAIDYATQTAAGLQAAHEKGITHRDIKSANIMVTDKGVVKIMDFGLAKLANRSKLTQLGTTLGTAAYMSPEQSRGENTDHRADIWSLGVVLYEMISGQMPFKGDYEQAVIYSIQNEDPEPLTALRTGVPIALDGIITKALAKEADTRYQHVDELPADLKGIGDLTNSLTGRSAFRSIITDMNKTTSKSKWWLTGVIGSLLGAVLTVIIMAQFDSDSINIGQDSRTVRKFSIELPEEQKIAFANNLPLGIGQPAMAISPDGTKLVYVVEQSNRTMLIIRLLDEWEGNPIVGSEGGYYPFFSPDGAWIGFMTNDKLKKVAVSGGQPFNLCDISHPIGASWAEDNWIYFAENQGNILSRVRAEGGLSEGLMVGNCQWPQVLPGGKTVLFWTKPGIRNQDYGNVMVYDVEKNEASLAFQGCAMARYFPTGHLVYGRAGALHAVSFDLGRLEPTGPSVLVVEGVRTESAYGAVQFALSQDGTLVYVAGPNRNLSRFVWVDREGTATPLNSPLRSYGEFKISPDGNRLAVQYGGEKDDIWSYEFARKAWSRLTTEGDNRRPLWSRDGAKVSFRSNRNGPTDLYSKNSDGSGTVERLTQMRGDASPRAYCWTVDGRHLLLSVLVDGKYRLWLLDNDDDVQNIEPYRGKSVNMLFASLSPDNRWLAYTSDDLGPWEVFVEDFPSSRNRWKVSHDGGEEPRWAPDGKELYYRNRDQWFVVPIEVEGGFRAGKAKVIFEGPYINVPGYSWDIHPDGKHFLVLEAEPQKNPRQLRVVLNWAEELKRKVAGGKP